MLIYWLCWGFVAAQVFSSLVSRGYSSLQGAGFSLRWFLTLWSTSSRSVRGLQHLRHAGLRAWAPLWHTGLVAPQCVGSPQTRTNLVPPSLTGKYLTTGPPGKSYTATSWSICPFMDIYDAFVSWLLWIVLLWTLQWQPTPVLLPGKSHGGKSLVGCSPWGHEESDTTERLHFPFSLSCIAEGNGNPLQCPCLENPRDGGAWWAAVYGVAQSWTWLKWLSSSSSSVNIGVHASLF